MMKEISKLDCLSRIYTNPSVRATAITFWCNAQVRSRHIMSISSHRTEARKLQRSSVKLSVNGLLRYSVKFFGWKTSAVARSSSSFKLRESSRWSSSFTKFSTGFRFQPQAVNSFFSNCHVGNLQGFMGNNSAGFH